MQERRSGKEEGISLIEYAITLPLIIALTVAALDLFSLWNAHAGLQQGVITGLRCLTTPESECNSSNESVLYEYERSELIPEYQLPVYTYSAEAQWIDVPVMRLSEFSATVLDTVSYNEVAGSYRLLLPEYQAEYVHWEELQRSPVVEFPSETSAGERFRNPIFSSLKSARGNATLPGNTVVSKERKELLLKVMTYQAPEGDSEARCIRRWEGKILDGGCNPKVSRVVLHVRGRARGRGRVSLDVAVTPESTGNLRLKNNEGLWKSLGGQNYSAGNASFFPRGIPQLVDAGGSLHFMPSEDRERLPQEFLDSYNRSLNVADGESLWIRISWEEGSSWQLEAVDFFSSVYSYVRRQDRAYWNGSSFIAATDQNVSSRIPAGKLDPLTVSIRGEGVVKTFCAYSMEEALKECAEDALPGCRIEALNDPLACYSAGKFKRKTVTCNENLGIEKNSNDIRHQVAVCGRDLFPPDHLNFANPVISEKRIELSVPSIELSAKDCNEAGVPIKKRLPTELQNFPQLSWTAASFRKSIPLNGMKPEELIKQRNLRCDSFKLRQKDVVKLLFEQKTEKPPALLSGEQKGEECDWESRLQSEIKQAGINEDYYLVLNRSALRTDWVKEENSGCGEAKRIRYRPGGKWEAVAGGPFRSMPPECAGDRWQCRISHFFREGTSGYLKEVALMQAAGAFKAHSPFYSEMCKNSGCFEVSVGDKRGVEITGKISVPLKSLKLLQSMGARDIFELSYSQYDNYESEYHRLEER